MINRTSLKFIGAFVVIVGLAMGGLYALNFYFSPEQKALREFKELERLYAEDTYGGSTPEETLQLFIDALKAGDIDLASKYFVVDERDEWMQKLQNTKADNDLNGFVELVESAKVRDQNKNTATLTYKIESTGGKVKIGDSEFDVPSGVYNQTIILSANQNGIWKIIDM